MIKKFTIYGERCSGTNYLEQLILKNFDVEITWDYGWKHWMGFNECKNSDDCLFIGIIRHPLKWLESLYKHKHHFKEEFTKNKKRFLYSEVHSYDFIKNVEIKEDYDLNNKKKPYKNIISLRNTKNLFLLQKMPKIVKNYILFRYEDLTMNFNKIMNKLVNKGLKIKENIDFPLNINDHYVGGIVNNNKIKRKKFFKSDLLSHPQFNLFLEIKILKYKI